MPERSRPLVLALTGGGTAGHVSPHLALLPLFRHRGWTVFYVGSKGIEREMIAKVGIDFYCISAGKLRRYFSMKNLFDVAKVFIGFVQCVFIFLRRRPDVVFSKGGFVSVPVAFAAWLLHIPVISHESDVTPGLANRIIGRVAAKLLYTFPETVKYLPKGKSGWTGTPVRSELFLGERLKGLELCGFDTAPAADAQKVILVMGGSQGAQRINDVLAEALPFLTKQWRVIHLAGRGKLKESGGDFKTSYKAFEFVTDELPHLLAAAEIVISRAGANSIFELLALHKPMLLIPLVQGSRGDQVLNAESFAREGWAEVLNESVLSPQTLQGAIQALFSKAEAIRARQSQVDVSGAAAAICAQIDTETPSF